MTKVVMIGLDGCTWRLLDPFVKAGLLPNLHFIVKNGASAKLMSTVPPITSPAWPSMVTGLNPGKLGVYSTIIVRRWTGNNGHSEVMVKPVTSDVYRGRAVWDYLSNEGFNVALFKVPFLYPVYKINGCMVSGFGSSSKFSAYPRYIHEKLVTGPSRLLEENLFARLETLRLEDRKSCMEFIHQLTELVHEESKIVLELSETLPWDFFFYVISATDWIQHAFMDRLIAIAENEYANQQESTTLSRALINFYQSIDALIGSFLDKIEKMDENYLVFLVSDHGFTVRPRTFNLARWLIEHGYMKLDAKTNSRSKITIPISKISHLAEKIASNPIVEQVLRILPASILSYLAGKYYRFRVSNIHSISELLDFDASEVFCLDDRAIYINPSISARAHRHISKRLTEELETYFKKIDELELRIHRKSEIYWGSKAKLAPDLIIQIIQGDNIWEISTNHKSPQTFKPRLPGIHNQQGIFSAYGPQVKRGVWLGEKLIWDVACTILHIFDLPIPPSMDGEVLKEIYTPNSVLALRPVKHGIGEKERIKRIVKKLKSKQSQTRK